MLMHEKICVIPIFTTLKAQGKCVIADDICYWKMKSVMALDGATSLFRLRDVNTNTCKHMRRSISICGISSVQWRKAGRS